MKLLRAFFGIRDYPQVSPKTVILWEPCSQSHGEIVPGYAKYLLDLGFDVLVLMTPDRIEEGLFSRFTHPRLHLTSLSQRQIRRFMKTQDVHTAAGILISTAGKMPMDKTGAPDLNRIFGGAPPDKVHFVEHDMARLQGKGDWPDRAITLRAMAPEYGNTHEVNPHYFGDVIHTPKNLEKTVFLMVGAARPKRRNDHLVINAAERLVAAGYQNFEIRLVGKLDGVDIPLSLTDKFIKLGRLSFSNLYDEVENSDFLLTAFQKDNPLHAYYRTTGTSGSFQLSYGFAKPGIYQRDYIADTVITEESSLLYDEDGDMMDAMKLAMEMSSEKYAFMGEAMHRSASKLAHDSRENLRALFGE